jgi:hypothetical protein
LSGPAANSGEASSTAELRETRRAPELKRLFFCDPNFLLRSQFAWKVEQPAGFGNNFHRLERSRLSALNPTNNAPAKPKNRQFASEYIHVRIRIRVGNQRARGHAAQARGKRVSDGDSIDDALEAIASLEKPEPSDTQDDGDVLESERTDQPAASPAEAPAMPPATPNSSSALAEADNYTKYGPGPLAAVRFKWTTRRNNDGDYFVDETIGESSYPLVSGPMTKEAAIKFVDDRERAARQRFEALRSEMAGGEIGRCADEQTATDDHTPD